MIPLPWWCGECGSSGVSLYWWCHRCIPTHFSSEPCTAIDPSAAKMNLTQP